jgi:histidinol-phosphate aminotransferase
VTETLTQRRSPDDLSMNETPYPPLPAVRALIEAGAATVHRYPDNFAGELVDAIAAHLCVDAARIAVGPGSAGLCQHLLRACGQRPEIVLPALSFEAYPLLVANAGARPVPVPMDGLRHDLDAMAAAVNDNTRAVLLCTPNNPTGAALRHDEVTAFLERIPPDVTVVIDEAYREFATDPSAVDGTALLDSHPNVCLLRTFSKAYGLAALRVGYALGGPATIGATRMTGMVFFPGALGQAAAVACLADPAQREMRARCAALAVARTALHDALRAAGVPVAPSEANFLWLPLGGASAAFAAHLRTAGILVRAYPDTGVRVTVGTDGAHARLLAAVSTMDEATRTGVPCGS